ncbi:MAG: hypothetical protein HY079_01415, partial [Elusimicrobia bacterium]|nr:hypothetical protein [Elusimicrobiota bacterium]
MSRLALAAALTLAGGAASAGPLDLPSGSFRVDAETAAAEGPWTETVLRFPSPVKSPWPANDTVWA